MGLEYTANAHVPWVHPAERITSWCSRLDGRFSSTTRLGSIASRFSRRNRPKLCGQQLPYGCHAGLDAVVLNLDARGVFLLGWVRMPSARDASLSVVSQGLVTHRFGRQSWYSGQGIRSNCLLVGPKPSTLYTSRILRIVTSPKVSSSLVPKIVESVLIGIFLGFMGDGAFIVAGFQG